MKKIITVFICMVTLVSMAGCSNSVNGNSSNENGVKEDIHSIKTFRKALQNWCSKNYKYDENFIRSKTTKGSDDKMLKESYKSKVWIYNKNSNYSFHWDMSSFHSGTYNEKDVHEISVDATSVSCLNDKNDGNSEILYFEDAFVYKIEDEKMKQSLLKRPVVKDELYYDGYYYWLGRHNTNRNFNEFLKDYVNGKY